MDQSAAAHFTRFAHSNALACRWTFHPACLTWLAWSQALQQSALTLLQLIVLASPSVLLTLDSLPVVLARLAEAQSALIIAPTPRPPRPVYPAAGARNSSSRLGREAVAVAVTEAVTEQPTAALQSFGQISMALEGALPAELQLLLTSCAQPGMPLVLQAMLGRGDLHASLAGPCAVATQQQHEQQRCPPAPVAPPAGSPPAAYLGVWPALVAGWLGCMCVEQCPENTWLCAD